MGNEGGEGLAKQAADAVREAIDAGTRRADEIVAAAEQEAERIRARAEADARERIERAQEAVDRLLRQADELRAAVSALGEAGKPPANESAETPTPEVDPTPATVPEPEPPREPEPSPPPTPEPQPPLEPEPQPPDVPEPSPPSDSRPSTEQLVEQLKGGKGGAETPDEAGARLVAMNLALDGKPRDEVARRLAEDHAIADPSRILDDVYSRVGK